MSVARARFGFSKASNTKGRLLKIPYNRVIATAGVLALIGGGSALANQGNGHGQGSSPAGTTGATGPGGHANGKQKVHKVMWVFKGTWTAADGTVKVTSGNSRVRKGGFLGTNVEFDLTKARIVVADTNKDGSRTVADLSDGDKVLVQARLPRKDPGDPPFTARKLVDQSHPPVKGQGNQD
jgi:hypothetical protein